MPVQVLAVVASAIFLARLLPQPFRLARSGVADGVSPLAAMNALVAAAAWTAYGLASGLEAVWIVSMLALIPGAWTVHLLRSHATGRDVAVAAGWAALVIVAGLTGMFATVLAIGVVVTQGPQVLCAVRAHDLSGISPSTWRIAVIDALAYGAYGLAIVDPALLGYSIVLLACAAVVLVRLRQVEAATSTARTAVPISDSSWDA